MCDAGKSCGVESVCLYGGTSKGPQISSLKSGIVRKHKSRKIAVALGVSLSCASLMVLLFGIFWYRHKRQHQAILFIGEYKEEGIVSLGNLKTFTFRELQQAIDSFSSKNILGAGGFGNVYREKLGDGSMVAVKRLKDVTGSSGESQFRTELEMISLACGHPGLEENVNTRHLQLLYESKLYRILQGGIFEIEDLNIKALIRFGRENCQKPRPVEIL
ncbi:hypothetical protein AHAS_Ahas11G0169900 [Arachis hypogaea]